MANLIRRYPGDPQGGIRTEIVIPDHKSSKFSLLRVHKTDFADDLGRWTLSVCVAYKKVER